MSNSFKIVDSHTHFFSYQWFEHFFNLARANFEDDVDVRALCDQLGWTLPPKDPKELGKQWVEEMERNSVSHQVLFASKLNDAEYLTAAVNAYPERLSGYVMIDPNDEQAREQTHYSLHILNMKGILLFPALHHFHAFDEFVAPICEEAMMSSAPVFIHFGQLDIPIFRKLGLPDPIDIKYSNPLDLKNMAMEFKEVNFIIPHFGCGKFDEALELASLCDNIFFDTSSSNSWIREPLTLKDVFERSLKVLGPQRILFGTDSSTFPRGWRKEIFDLQLGVLNELGIPSREQSMIFGENSQRLLNFKLK